ncbi:MAG: hypothetical protein AAF605_06585 [Myxococcota bacterium]
MLNEICVAVVAAGLSAGWFESDPYEEERELRVEAAGIETLVVEAGAGSLSVRGVEGLKAIELLATVQVQEGEEEAKETIREHLVLSLKRSGSSAKLVSRFAGERSVNGGIKLEVRVPSGTGLDIDDGSGSIRVHDVTQDLVVLDDGSGSLRFTNIGGDVVRRE